eukprot:scaffold1141_cov333-Pavlova_lutheri.AAC.38
MHLVPWPSKRILHASGVPKHEAWRHVRAQHDAPSADQSAVSQSFPRVNPGFSSVNLFPTHPAGAGTSLLWILPKGPRMGFVPTRWFSSPFSQTEGTGRSKVRTMNCKPTNSWDGKHVCTWDRIERRGKGTASTGSTTKEWVLPRRCAGELPTG